MRDGAPGSAGRRASHRDRRSVRVLPPVVLPGGRRPRVLRARGAGRARPRPRGAHSSPARSSPRAEARLATDPALARRAAGPIAEAFGVRVPPPLGRASARPPAGAHQKPLTSPPPPGKEKTRPCPCDPHLAAPLLNQAVPARMPTRLHAPGGGLDTRYEQLHHAALHARAQAFPLGLRVLTRRGVTTWRHARAHLAVRRPAPPSILARPHRSRPRSPPARPRPGSPSAQRTVCRPRPGPRRLRGGGRRHPMLPRTTSSKVTAATPPRTALCTSASPASSPSCTTPSPRSPSPTSRQGDRAGLGQRPSIPVVDVDQGQLRRRAADREGFRRLVAEVSSAGPGSCSPWNAPGSPATPPTGASSSSSAG